MKKRRLFAVMVVVCLMVLFTASTTPAATLNWKLQSFAPAGMWYYETLLKSFVDNVKQMSGGRLVITQYPAGALVPSTEIMDALGKGVMEMGNGVGAYWPGKIPVCTLEWSVPFTVDMREADILFWDKGWNDLYRKAYAEKNVFFAGPVCGVGSAIMSTKPIRSLADLKKMKIRSTGLAATVLTKAGVPTVFVPGEEIYTALATGVIDGATYGAATSQYDLKIHEVAKYFLKTLIGAQNVENVIVNLKAWNALPDDLKKIVEMATREMSSQRMRYYYVSEIRVLDRMIKEYKVTATQLPAADVTELTKVSMAHLDEVAAKDPKYTAPAVKVLKDFMKELGYLP